MALLLKVAAVLRDFLTGSVSAMNSGMQSRQAKEQVVTTQGRKKCDGEFCGRAESSVRLPLFRGLASSRNPPAKQQGPEGRGSRESRNGKANAAADCLAIDGFHSVSAQGNRKNLPCS